MMGKIFAILIAMLFASVASANGALAIDSNQGDQYGFSYNHGSMQQAQSRALSECGYGCRVVQTFSRRLCGGPGIGELRVWLGYGLQRWPGPEHRAAILRASGRPALHGSGLGL